jgi:hypothetical protein
MRARTITTIVVLGALAIPVSASAAPTDSGPYSSVNAITGGSNEPASSPGSPYGGPGFVTPTAITGSSSGEPIVVSGPAAGTVEGFDWTDAALGAGGALALVAFGAAALLTVRRRTAMSPASTS